MGRPVKKGKKGTAAHFITRNQALKKLQVSLAEFRRLCILKGVYPREPKKKVFGKDKTYYYTKDISFLAHEPLLFKFREMKTWERKVHKARMKGQHARVKKLNKEKPVLIYDHLVKERYPTFIDAVRDLDDALCTVTIFANMPSTDRVLEEQANRCQRLMAEFYCYLIRSKSLRKMFFSIKGVYLQAEIFGQPVTWLTPYRFSQEVPKDVDYRVLASFLDFYVTQLHFVNFKLFRALELVYPPRLNEGLASADAGVTALVLEREGDAPPLPSATSKTVGAKSAITPKRLKAIAKAEAAGAAEGDDAVPVEDLDENMGASDDEGEGEGDDEADGVVLIFKDLKFFLAREVPKEVLEVAIKCLGGLVGWEGVGSPFSESDESITHQVVDRSFQKHRHLDREYVQPQWVADSVNAALLIPTESYMPGVEAPPHLSPFVRDEEEGYMPDQRKYILQLQGQLPAEGEEEEEEGDNEGDEQPGIGGSDDEDEEADAAARAYEEELATEMAGEAPQEPVKEDPAKKLKRKKAKQDAEETERAKMMMKKKDRRLFEKISFAKGRKDDEVKRLKRRRNEAKAETK